MGKLVRGAVIASGTVGLLLVPAVASAAPVENPLDGRSPNGKLINGQLRGVIDNFMDTAWWLALVGCSIMCIFGAYKVGVNRKSGMAQSAFEGTGMLWSAAGAAALVASTPLWLGQILDMASGT